MGTTNALEIVERKELALILTKEIKEFGKK
jgi:hypothetical protein